MCICLISSVVPEQMCDVFVIELEMSSEQIYLNDFNSPFKAEMMGVQSRSFEHDNCVGHAQTDFTERRPILLHRNTAHYTLPYIDLRSAYTNHHTQ